MTKLMKNINYYLEIILTLAMAILVASCSKDEIEYQPQLGEYPSEIGNKWIYLHYRKSSNLYDTLTVSIIGKTNLDNGWPVKIIVFKYPNSVDTNYLYASKDTARIFDTRKSYSSLYGYVFPLKKGNYWTQFSSYMYTDSTIVCSDEHKVQVFQNCFYNAFDLHTMAWQFEYEYDCRTCFVPGIGPVEVCYSYLFGDYDYIKLLKINFRPTRKSKLN